MLHAAVTWLTNTIFDLGYPGIFLLMAIESSLFPFPSEVVLPPAGYLAAQGRMNGFIALGAGVAGSMAGAFFNYFLALHLGRPVLHRFLDRYSRFLLLRAGALDKAERTFRRHGEISTFLGRLVPGIRQLISLPAGLAQMHTGRFAAYTALGAGIWCAILTFIGWYLGAHGQVLLENLQENVRQYTLWITAALIPFMGVTIWIYVARRRRKQPKPAADAITAE